MRLIIAIIICATLLAVTRAAPVPKDTAKPVLYFPTTVGVKWVYAVNGPGIVDFDLVQTVTKVEERNKSWFVTVANLGDDGTSSQEFLYEVSEQGIKQVGHTSSSTFQPTGWTMLSLPRKDGQFWEKPMMVDKGLELVKVGEAEVEAIRVEEPQTKREWWYAREIGLVRFRSGRLSHTLKSFTPGPSQP